MNQPTNRCSYRHRRQCPLLLCRLVFPHSPLHSRYLPLSSSSSSMRSSSSSSPLFVRSCCPGQEWIERSPSFWFRNTNPWSSHDAARDRFPFRAATCEKMAPLRFDVGGFVRNSDRGRGGFRWLSRSCHSSCEHDFVVAAMRIVVVSVFPVLPLRPPPKDHCDMLENTLSSWEHRKGNVVAVLSAALDLLLVVVVVRLHFHHHVILSMSFDRGHRVVAPRPYSSVCENLPIDVGMPPPPLLLFRHCPRYYRRSVKPRE